MGSLRTHAEDHYPVTYNLTPPVRKQLLRELKGKTSVSLSTIRKMAKQKNIAAKTIHELYARNGIKIEDDGPKAVKLVKQNKLADEVFGPASMEVVDFDDEGEEEAPPPLIAESPSPDWEQLEQLAQEEKQKYDRLETEALSLSQEAQTAVAQAKEQMLKTAELRRETKAVREQLSSAQEEAALYKHKFRQEEKRREAAEETIARMEEIVRSVEDDYHELRLRRIMAMIERGLPKGMSVADVMRDFEESSRKIEERIAREKESKAKPKTTAKPKTQPSGDGRKLLTVKDIAQKYGVRETSVSNWKHKGFPDPAKKIGQAYYYDAVAVEQWYTQRQNGKRAG